MIRSLTVRGSSVLPGLLAMFVFFAFDVLPTRAQETDTLDKETAAKVFPKKPYSPYAGQAYPTHVYFGDTHLHTSQSFDAVMFGNRLGPEDAYRFARGEGVMSSTGQRVLLSYDGSAIRLYQFARSVLLVALDDEDGFVVNTVLLAIPAQLVVPFQSVIE
jgi:hypothetical protein